MQSDAKAKLKAAPVLQNASGRNSKSRWTYKMHLGKMTQQLCGIGPATAATKISLCQTQTRCKPGQWRSQSLVESMSFRTLTRSDTPKAVRRQTHNPW